MSPLPHPSPFSVTRFTCVVLSYVLLVTLIAPLTRSAALRPAAPAALMANQSGKSAAQRAGEVLVRFRPEVTDAEKSTLVAARGARRGRQLRGASRFERLELTGGQTPQQFAQQLADQPSVEWVEPNYLVNKDDLTPNDARFNEQWALRNTGGNAGGQPESDIAAPLAWERTTGSTTTVIAVIDSGIDFTHPDLAHNGWNNSAERANNRDDDRDGFVDDLKGWDWVASSNQIKDEQGHGTSVAGIIAAEGNNAMGTTGVMWRASLMSLRVLDNTGTGDVADAVEAIDYAVAHGAQVINISWGLEAQSLALSEAIERAGARGVVVVCSAGNGGRNIDGQPYYPASYDLPNLMSVGASDGNDNLTSWSNWGATRVSVAAPGVSILTTRMGGDYHSVTGTSASAPLVTGMAGLIKSAYPGLSASDTRASILTGTRQVASLSGKVAAGGVAHAPGALVKAGSLGYGSGVGNGNGNGNGNNGNGNGGNNGGGNGQWHSQSPRPDKPERGSGGRGPGGSFDAAPSAATGSAPAHFMNQDNARRQGTPNFQSPAFIHADLLPVCDDDCGGGYATGGAGGSDPYFGTARNELPNRTGQTSGVDVGSRNLNWSLPLVSLSGRAGFDLNIALYYNSLVWTKQGTAIQYNADHGFPGPGFHLGFPTLQPRYYNSNAGLNAFVMITSSGGRVEMRQVNNGNTYESADGSYTHLTDDGTNGITVRTTDGTQLKFVFYSAVNEYRCTQIKDRNGNYITVNYDPNIIAGTLGRPTSVVDTLGRTVSFIYDAQNYLTSIRQSWQREAWSGTQIVSLTETHEWAKFSYSAIRLQPSFPSLSVVATTNADIPVLTRVDLPDKSFYQFEYENPWGIIKRISHYGPDDPLYSPSRLINYSSYNIPAGTSAQTDCPRFSEQRDWAQDWNGDTDGLPATGEEALTTYAFDASVTWTMPGETVPNQHAGTRTTVISPPFIDKDGVQQQVVSKFYAHSSTNWWEAGLTVLEETYQKRVNPPNEGSPLRSVTTAWVQDNTTFSGLSVGAYGFESPVVGYGGYQYGPGGSAWSFAGGAGLTGNNSGFTNGNNSAPEGAQVAFLQGGSGSVISQAIGGFKRGVPYKVIFSAAQRNYVNQGGQDFDVYLDDQLLQTFRPTGINYASYSVNFTTTPGTHTLKFVGRNTYGGDNTAFIDNVAVAPYAGVPVNSRPSEINIYDASNRKRTVIDYTDYSLPAAVFEYDANGTSLIRQTNTSYDLSPAYVNNRIIGLVSAQEVYGVSGSTYSMVSRVAYGYDQYALNDPLAVARHDGTTYGAGTVAGRGLQTSVARFDVTAPYDTSKMVQSTTGYDKTGNVVWAKDGEGHETQISYADDYTSSGANALNTRAYPTKVTVNDPAAYFSTVKYNYNLGAAYLTTDPKGAAQTTVYDDAGRLSRVTNAVNSSYTRYEYDPNWGHTRSYTPNESGEAYTNTIRDGAGQVRLFVASNPNSTGGYLATWTKYDALGRTVEQSNPTEIYGDGTPAGDDAYNNGAGGYKFTKQSYDWKGRPTLTTFPAVAGQTLGNTKELSYGGCGCAGGEVTTFRDERGRRKRYTKDVLGRLSQVEELNLDQTVYAYTTYYYNARDQLVNINQAGQWRGFQYDGHGRLAARTTPEQGLTTYAYYKDDSTQTVTDARGATMSFVYNNRHLVKNINYAAPLGSSVAATANVSYEYDAAGNRTSMTDGAGSVSYSYNTLSQLEWERRTFNGVTGPNDQGSFQLSYQYNLSGQLKRVTNPWNAEVAYAHDAQGRVTDVTGANYAGGSTYASNLRYRAFGGLKGLTYGNNLTLALAYDARLRLKTWNVAGVLGWDYRYDNFYENTHRVTYAKNISSSGSTNGDATLDRSFEYDQVGRMQYAHTGVEARSLVGETTAGVDYGPYSQHISYDVWGNMTERAGWGGANASYTATYTNKNQRAGLSYDASGNLTWDGGQTFSYDATGQQASAGNSGYSLLQGYDGDRLRVKKKDQGYDTYYLRSSVLGNQVVAETDGTGSWSRGYVYLGSQLLAIQSGGVKWVHQDPVVKSQRLTDTTGAWQATVELDPWGGETNKSSQQWQQPQRYTSYLRDVNESDDAQMRRYNRWWSRFDQPDPYNGSYNFTDPQSLNRYSYVQNDPVNYVDPMGLLVIQQCTVDWISIFGERIYGTPYNCRTIYDDSAEGGGISITKTIDKAKEAIVNSEACQSLFKDHKSALDKLEQLKKEGGVKVEDKSMMGFDGKSATMSERGLVGAFYDGRIYINPNNPEIKDDYTDHAKQFPNAPYQKIRSGVSRDQFATAILIHELLHATGDFGPDIGNQQKSLTNTLEVILKCIKSSPPPNK